MAISVDRGPGLGVGTTYVDSRAPPGGIIVDSRGNPYTAPRDPLKGITPATMASAVYRDLPALYLAPEWTVDEVRAALAAHVVGMFQLSAILADAIIGDDRVQASLGSRVGALLGLPVMHSGPDADVLAAWVAAYPRLAPSSQLYELRSWALLLGFGVAEVLWDTSATPWQPYLKTWHPQNIRFDWASRTLRAVSQDGEIEIIPGDGRWFVHAPYGIERGWMHGLVRALALPWLLRSFAQRDWARFSEVHGSPIRLATIPAMASEEDKALYISSLSTMGKEAVVALPQGVDGEGFGLDLLEASSQSWQGFLALIGKCDMAITLTLQWQNLAGGSEVKEGSLAAARVHSDVKQSALEFDASALARDIHEQLARPFAAWNFGDAEKAPTTLYDTETQEDRTAKVATLESFARAVGGLATAGVPIDVGALGALYDIEIPTTVGSTARPPIFGYHLDAAVVRRDEMRARLGLPPIGGDIGDELLGVAPPAAPEPPATEAP